MRLLVVGFPNSIHIVRHLALLRDTGWDVHVFASTPALRVHAELAGVTVHIRPGTRVPAGADVRVRYLEGPEVQRDMARLGLVSRATAALALARLIGELEPAVLHSEETQSAGYLTLDARAQLGGAGFPPWLLTTWGSDIYWHGRDPRQRPRLRAVLRAVDYLCADCLRDAGLARAFGFRGRAVPCLPVAGGMDRTGWLALRRPGPTSARRDIVLTGQIGPHGRPDVAIEALRRCGPTVLAGHRLRVLLADRVSAAAARALAAEVGLELEVFVDDGVPLAHDAVLAMHGGARLSIRLSNSDGLPSAFLEAAAMGAFPVQSNASCAREYVRDGVSAALVDHRDVEGVTRAIRRALTDDALVDRAAAINDRMIAAQLDIPTIRRRVIDMYERIAADRVLVAS